jgi:pimeloyl-ACP methyl ester carboxylesterase
MTMSGALVACVAIAAVFGQTAPRPAYSEHFVEVQGIRLHYLDWGGEGEPVVFLTGLNTPAATFDNLAVGLRSRFRVYGLTRRGLPPSEVPATGYELATLVGDIVGFLNANDLPRVHLVGHSLAGLEMTRIASSWPERVLSLVYLDAVSDPATAHAVLLKDPVGLQPATGAVWTQISRWWNAYSVDFSGVKAPTLSISAMKRRHPGIPPDATTELRRRAEAYWQSAVVPVAEGWLARFRREVPHATAITWEEADHYFYLDRGEDVLAEMKAFYSAFR